MLMRLHWLLKAVPLFDGFPFHFLRNPASPVPATHSRECLAESTVLTVSLRSGAGSEAAALRYPVMPIANGLGCGFVGIDGSQLR